MPKSNRRGVSRRTLFKGAGLAAASGAILSPLDALAKETVTPTQGPGALEVTLQVNGRERKVSAEPRQTLLDVLRLPPLDMTGAKPVCDRGQCGACTVMLDDETVYACTVLAVEAEGREITTVEGLGTPENMSSVQKAFCEEDALQCGFCTPGLVVSCTWATRTHGKDLTEAEARAATAGNLCRCGTHPHVLKAAMRAAKEA